MRTYGWGSGLNVRTLIWEIKESFWKEVMSKLRLQVATVRPRTEQTGDTNTELDCLQFNQVVH